MEISKSIEQRYLHDMAVDQLAADYSQLGYEVAREEPIGSSYADLVARKGSETIIFEVKTGRMNEALRQKLGKLSAYAKQTPNHRFRVVFATPPQTKTIEVDNLEEVLTSYLIHQETPEAIQELSSNTVLDNVSGLTISSITVLPTGELTIAGSGTMEVTLQLGSSDGVEIPDSYPFEFDATLHHNGQAWQIAELTRCEVDTSSFYE